MDHTKKTADCTNPTIEIIGCNTQPADTFDSITIDLSDLNQAALDTMDTTIFASGLSNDVISIGPGAPTWTIGSSGPFIMQDHDVMHQGQSNKISIKGKDADIDINGVSLMETLRGIQDRLNILKPNQDLEQEWDQLKELGDRYRQLEKELEEKSKVWKALKS